MGYGPGNDSDPSPPRHAFVNRYRDHWKTLFTHSSQRPLRHFYFNLDFYGSHQAHFCWKRTQLALIGSNRTWGILIPACRPLNTAAVRPCMLNAYVRWIFLCHTLLCHTPDFQRNWWSDAECHTEFCSDTKCHTCSDTKCHTIFSSDVECHTHENWV